MKRITKTLLLALTLALSFTGCSNDDDLDEIFRNRNWNLTFVQNGTERVVPQENGYTLYFSETAFTFTTPAGATAEGNWYADGGSHTITFSDITASNAINDNPVAQAVITILQNAVMYSGDANWIQIIEEPGYRYMQFYNR